MYKYAVCYISSRKWTRGCNYQKKKNQLNTKECSNGGNEGQKKKALKHAEKQKNGKGNSLLTCNYLKNKWFKLSDQKTENGRITF